MVVGVLRLELILHAPQNLKEKRGIVRSILGRCRNRFPVSCCETGLHDLWQRAQLGFSIVGVDEASIDRTFSDLEEQILSLGTSDITDRYLEYLHY